MAEIWDLSAFAGNLYFEREMIVRSSPFVHSGRPVPRQILSPGKSASAAARELFKRADFISTRQRVRGSRAKSIQLAIA